MGTGFDDRILLQFLHGDLDNAEQPPFAPAAITFESVLLDRERITAVLHRLRKHGYTRQCKDMQNIVSTRAFLGPT